MKYVDEYRNKQGIKEIAWRIQQIMPSGNINIMEVCGTHTQNFRRFGLNRILPSRLRLIAGPGCPVCVSDQSYLDRAIALAKIKETIILTFGDMLRVPGSQSSLERQRAEGLDVRVLYSPWESLKVAKDNPHKKVIFLAVGFETTAPTFALTIKAAQGQGLQNLFFFSALKVIPAAMQTLVSDPRLKIDGFLCPGHVSTIIGIKPYAFIPKRYKISCCVAGFEPLDILEGIYLLLQRIVKQRPAVINQYRRAVSVSGNLKAQKIIAEVFALSDVPWRGLGSIPKSGLKIKAKFAKFDAEKNFQLKTSSRHSVLSASCKCGDILKGLLSPADCPLFAKTCSPELPIGPCMVSSEGACNAYYRYR